MEVFFTGETTIETGVGEVIGNFNTGRRIFFSNKQYGASLPRLVLLLICRPVLLKQRIRFVQKTTLYVDVMLDLEEFKTYDLEQCHRAAAAQILSKLPSIISKYKFKDFDLPRFMTDLKEYLETRQTVQEQSIH